MRKLPVADGRIVELLAPLSSDLSRSAAEPARIDPAGSRPGPDEVQKF